MKLKTTWCCTHSFPPHMHKILSPPPPPPLLTAVKNQVTGNFILNAKSEDAESKTFIENGLQWDYTMEGQKETLKTSGPLHEGIVVLVSEARSSLSTLLCFIVYVLNFRYPRLRSFPRKKMQRSAWHISILYTRTCYRLLPTTMFFWLNLTPMSGHWRVGLSAPNLVGEVSECIFNPFDVHSGILVSVRVRYAELSTIFLVKVRGCSATFCC